jgi:hypothetical protein
MAMGGPNEPGERRTPGERAGGAPDPHRRELSFPEAERLIVALLRERGPLTTQQVQSSTMSVGVRCPDSTVRFLTKLRMRGTVLGTVDRKRGTWVWWLEGQAPPGEMV